MAAWDPARYLEFERERTQACRDLVARIEGLPFGRIVDLGCGPGTSAAVLKARWPTAEITGVDSSPAMLAAARRADPSGRWVEADIATWAPDGPVDLLVSNAALQWLGDHTSLFPRLFREVAPGGAFAAQMPVNVDEPYQRAATRLQRRAEWRGYLAGDRADFGVGPPELYYDLLAPAARRVDIWDTGYQHVLDGPDAVVAWTTGTGLRPWLASLPDDGSRERFRREYARELEAEYPRRPDGRVLFPFHRRFVVAYR